MIENNMLRINCSFANFQVVVIIFPRNICCTCMVSLVIVLMAEIFLHGERLQN